MSCGICAARTVNSGARVSEESPNSPHGFDWRMLPEFSDLLNVLGRHGFQKWPDSADGLRTALETLRLDPEQDIAVIKNGESICGYALVLTESDIDRLVASVAALEKCTASIGPLLRFVDDRALAYGITKIHMACRQSEKELSRVLQASFFRRVTANLELTLDRKDAGRVTDVALPVGFQVRSMRSSAETLLLTRVQNTVFSDHWGFSKNSPEEIQSKLDQSVSGPEHVLFIESPDGDIAAYVWTALEWDGSHTCGKIWMTGVMPEFRSMGLGRSVVNAGIKHLFANGAADIHLEVLEDNAAAVQIYGRMGFSETGQTDWYEKKL